ncbi:hypothetical protein Cni_G24518 [Canna indica]|uniref:Uncharacterized protein n=1 Tax=Canna indica TaxID=4628 RepID=A0AAQ3L2J0_9LILI|nr:hypothetical protein Cni_G24518 [Canna indica]
MSRVRAKPPSSYLTRATTSFDISSQYFIEGSRKIVATLSKTPNVAYLDLDAVELHEESTDRGSSFRYEFGLFRKRMTTTRLSCSSLANTGGGVSFRYKFGQLALTLGMNDSSTPLMLGAGDQELGVLDLLLSDLLFHDDDGEFYPVRKIDDGNIIEDDIEAAGVPHEGITREQGRRCGAAQSSSR